MSEQINKNMNTKHVCPYYDKDADVCCHPTCYLMFPCEHKESNGSKAKKVGTKGHK